VIENIERLRSKFEARIFGYLETLVQRHVEISTSWVIEEVSWRSAKCQPARGGKRTGIVKEWAEACERKIGNTRSGISDKIGVTGSSASIRNN